ncbi:hypothetical protein [Deinococcus pimensis]|nr:hypothetical protein [Deinococcus pimensis]
MKLKFVLPVLLLTACLSARGGTSASTEYRDPTDEHGAADVQ